MYLVQITVQYFKSNDSINYLKHITHKKKFVDENA